MAQATTQHFVYETWIPVRQLDSYLADFFSGSSKVKPRREHLQQRDVEAIRSLAKEIYDRACALETY